MDNLHAARADAEAGIARADTAIGEAQEPHSTIAAHLARYVAQRAAWALVAARLAARIEREEATNEQVIRNA